MNNSASTSKGGNKKGDLTALVKINIVSNKVVEVKLVKGAIEQNIDTLGHSNDFTYLNGKYYGAWYQENGKEDYSNKIGEIGAKLKNNGVVGKFIFNDNVASVFNGCTCATRRYPISRNPGRWEQE